MYSRFVSGPDRTCGELFDCLQQFGQKLMSKVVRDNWSISAQIFARQWLALHYIVQLLEFTEPNNLKKKTLHNTTPAFYELKAVKLKGL